MKRKKREPKVKPTTPTMVMANNKVANDKTNEKHQRCGAMYTIGIVVWKSIVQEYFPGTQQLHLDRSCFLCRKRHCSDMRVCGITSKTIQCSNNKMYAKILTTLFSTTLYSIAEHEIVLYHFQHQEWIVNFNREIAIHFQLLYHKLWYREGERV